MVTDLHDYRDINDETLATYRVSVEGTKTKTEVFDPTGESLLGRIIQEEGMKYAVIKLKGGKVIGYEGKPAKGYAYTILDRNGDLTDHKNPIEWIVENEWSVEDYMQDGYAPDQGLRRFLDRHQHL